MPRTPGVHGMTPLIRELTRLSNLETRRVLTPIAEELLTNTKDRFRDSRGVDGRAWADLAPSTIARRRKGRGQGAPKILVDRARLRNSITYRVDGLKIELGTNVRYARIHNKGGPAGRGKQVNIPARPFLGISDEDRRFVRKTLTDWIEGR